MLATLPAAQRFAVRLTGDPTAAEDVLHDALVRAALAWRGFRGESSFRTWLFQIIVNAFRDALRRGRRKHNSIDDAPEPAGTTSDPVSAAAREELGTIVARHVSRLPPRQRELLVLVVYEDMSPAEAARLLGISESNARANLHFARERLSRELVKYLGDVTRERTS